MGSAFQDTDRFPKLSYFAWNLAKVPHTLSVYPSGSKLGLFSLYRQRFPRYGSIFKLAISGHDTGHWQSFRNCTLHSLFLPQGVEIELSFPRYRPIFKIAIFGHEAWQSAKSSRSCTYYDILSFYPMESKLSLFLLHGQRFQRYGLIFKITIFGHETSSLTKSPKVSHILVLCFYPKGQGAEIGLIFALWAARFQR